MQGNMSHMRGVFDHLPAQARLQRDRAQLSESGENQKREGKSILNLLVLGGESGNDPHIPLLFPGRESPSGLCPTRSFSTYRSSKFILMPDGSGVSLVLVCSKGYGLGLGRGS